MGWDWNAITARWPGVSDLAYDSETIVEAYDRRDRHLGHDWNPRLAPQVGTYAPLSIVVDGRRLAALDKVAGTGRFEKRLQRSDHSAWAELEGLFILRSGTVVTEVEIEPSATIGARSTRPDWRVRANDDSVWTVVEVTRPDESAATRRVREFLEPLASDHDPTRARGVTLHLRRRPSAADLETIREVIAEFRRSPGSRTIELPDGLGVLDAEIGAATPELGGSMIKWIVPDDRGVSRLTKKAGQLPVGGPTLVMLDVSSTLVDWSGSIAGALAAGDRPWISAVCLFTSGFAPSPRGEAWSISSRLIENPTASNPLPDWARRSIGRFVPSGFDGP